MQALQIQELGVEKWLNDVVRFSATHKYSEASTTKLIELLDVVPNLCKVIVQSAAQTDAGRPFVEATYTLEANGPMIFVAHAELEKLDRLLALGIALPKLEAAASRAAELMLPFLKVHDTAIAAAIAKVSTATTSSASACKKLEAFSPPDALPPGRNRIPAQRYVDRDAPAAAPVAVPSAVARAALEAAVTTSTAEVAAAAEAVTAANKSKSDWKSQVGPVTKEDFVVFASAGCKVGYDYYIQKYNTHGGELFDLKRAYHGATIFNPFNLASFSLDKCSLLINELRFFGFPEFTPHFLQGLKSELAQLKVQALIPYNWAAVPGANDYDAALARRVKNAVVGDDQDDPRAVVFKDWKDD
jgi:hypothetical protein